MTFQLEIDNPNGSTSKILVMRLMGRMVWNWEEVGPNFYLDDDSMDRVEDFILDTLGEPDDFSMETMLTQKRYVYTQSLKDRTDHIVSQYI